jgi:hypothetical protein
MTFNPGKEFEELLEELSGGSDNHKFSRYEMNLVWALGIKHGRRILKSEILSRGIPEQEHYHGTL